MLICFRVVCGHFHATMAEMSNCHRDLMAGKAQNIYHLVLYRIILPTPCLGQWRFLSVCETDLTGLAAT